MLLVPPRYGKIFIIGNGFDLNLGLKTAYADFARSQKFVELLHKSNAFARLLNERFTDATWLDAEVELKYLANQYSPQLSSEAFNQLCQNLLEYIAQVGVPENFKNTKAFHLFKDNWTTDSLIIDFNYTNSTELILKELKTLSLKPQDHIIKVHGSVKEQAIVFGVEDECKIPRPTLYILKSHHKAFKGINLNQAWQSVREVHIFGHSLGETDHPYFQDFFRRAADGDFIPNRVKLHLHYYGDKAYDDLMSQIYVMTSNQIRKLKQHIEFIPINVA